MSTQLSEISIKVKAAYVIQMNLAALMFGSLASDDA